MVILEVSHLSMSFAEKQLYTDAEFSLNKEDHLGVIGQYGAGKSTLIKLITKQLFPDESFEQILTRSIHESTIEKEIPDWIMENVGKEMYSEAYEKADIVAFLTAHDPFKSLPYRTDKVILDFCGIYKK